MSGILTYILEIIKIALPAFIVFFTVYTLFKQFLEGQIKLKSLENQQNNTNHSFPAKIQAMERLVLLMERIRINNLLLRLDNGQLTPKELRAVMLLGIQQEFDHNVSQRLYVSEKLWEILTLTRFEITQIIAESYNQTTDNSIDTFKKNMQEKLVEFQKDPVDIAIDAIKKEAAILL